MLAGWSANRGLRPAYPEQVRAGHHLASSFHSAHVNCRHRELRMITFCALARLNQQLENPGRRVCQQRPSGTDGPENAGATVPAESRNTLVDSPLGVGSSTAERRIAFGSPLA
jgi:hypothetical protein